MIYFRLLLIGLVCSIVLNSCGFKIRARNMPANLKDYTAYSNGDTIFVDGTKSLAKTPPGSLAAKPLPSKTKSPAAIPAAVPTEMKTGKSFQVFEGNQTYAGLYYGKLNLLGVQGRVYNGQTNKFDRSWSYYLQQRGTNTIEPYSPKTLVNMVRDNKKAYAAAKASRIYSNIALPSVALFIGGLTTAVLTEDGPVKKIAGTAGLVAMPLWIVSMPLANSKSNKAIKTYNRRK